MNELREQFKPPREIQELNEITKADGDGIFSSELTRQEADDKVAVLLEERHNSEEVEKTDAVTDGVGMSSAEESKLRSMANEARDALGKANLMEQELNRLKSKRNRERDPVKRNQLESDIRKQESKAKSAKEDYAKKDKAYKNYMTMIRNRDMHRNLF